MGNDDKNKVSYFDDSITDKIALPERFTFPFNYEPHPLAKIAAEELQHYLETQTDLDHNFGIAADNTIGAVGKMFGVLVIQDAEGKPGYLSAFSGKLAGSNDHPKFVLPVFDMLVENSFLVKGLKAIDSISAQVNEITSNENYIRLKLDIMRLTAESLQEISAFKKQLKANKELRRNSREEQKKSLSEEDNALFEKGLVKQSLHDKHQLNKLTDKWEQLQEKTAAELAPFETRIETLKTERKEKSAALQGRLFEQYVFLNKDGQCKTLQDIFKLTATGKPPSAAGECATPKLLQFAFLNGYKPLAMAEFWWGVPPKSEARKHKEFYPACTAKCKPILAYMLEGMLIEEDPLY